MSTPTDLLRKIDFFEPLDQKIITKVAQVCIEREYSKGAYIVKQGESGLGLFFIISGRVNVEVERNEIKVIVATLQANDVLGELSIIDNKPRSANVICLEETRCLLLTRDSFLKLVNKYPDIAINMAKALASRIRAADEKVFQPQPAVPATEAAAIPGAESQPQAAVESDTTTAGNGGAGPSAKNQVKDYLVDTFKYLYVAKALTRFSAAIIGCPVEIHVADPGPQVAQTVIEGVKVALFSASKDRIIRIEAYDRGEFSATVLQPQNDHSEIRVSSFEGCVRRHERMFLHVHKDAPARLLESPIASS